MEKNIIISNNALNSMVNDIKSILYIDGVINKTPNQDSGSQGTGLTKSKKGNQK